MPKATVDATTSAQGTGEGVVIGVDNSLEPMRILDVGGPGTDGIGIGRHFLLCLNKQTEIQLTELSSQTFLSQCGHLSGKWKVSGSLVVPHEH